MGGTTFFFFNDTATTEIYTLSLHDALPISFPAGLMTDAGMLVANPAFCAPALQARFTRNAYHGTEGGIRSEEHTSELQSPCNIVCRLLLEKKKKYIAGSHCVVPSALLASHT